jgi:hypothetical protein
MDTSPSKTCPEARNEQDSKILSLYVLLLLAGISLTLRFPFFFPAVINWDESTFILLGQNILDGELPYTTLWDLKPPLTFYTFAFFISVLGDSIIAIRIGGLLFLLATAYLTYFVGKSLYDQRAGVIAAILCILFISSAPAGQATMTETLAILPLMGGLAILVRCQYTFGVLFFLGMLLSSASLIRLNLGYVAVAVGLLLLYEFRNLGISILGARLLAYVIGGLVVFALVAVPYYATGQGSLFIDSVLVAPLKYSGARLSVLDALGEHLKEDFGFRNAVLWISSLIGMAFSIVRSFRSSTTRQKEKVKITGTFFVAVAWSIIASGAAHGHYLIQIIPIMSIFAGMAIGRGMSSKARHGVLALVFLGSIIPLKEIYSQYYYIAHRVKSGLTLSYGPQYEIAEWLRNENPLAEPVYLMTDHIVYWFTSGRPLTKATTHPSNIAKEYMLDTISGPNSSTSNEMSRILSLSPLFIVKKKRTRYLRKKADAERILEQTLSERYVEVAVIHGRHIYKLRSRS